MNSLFYLVSCAFWFYLSVSNTHFLYFISPLLHAYHISSLHANTPSLLPSILSDPRPRRRRPCTKHSRPCTPTWPLTRPSWQQAAPRTRTTRRAMTPLVCSTSSTLWLLMCRARKMRRQGEGGKERERRRVVLFMDVFIYIHAVQTRQGAALAPWHFYLFEGGPTRTFL